MDDAPPEGGRDRPLNRPDNERLRRVELAAFGILMLLLGASLAFRGIQFLAEGRAVFSVIGLSLPSPSGVVAGAFYLALATGIVAGTLVMWLRFRK